MGWNGFIVRGDREVVGKEILKQGEGRNYILNTPPWKEKKKFQAKCFTSRKSDA